MAVPASILNSYARITVTLRGEKGIINDFATPAEK